MQDFGSISAVSTTYSDRGLPWLKLPRHSALCRRLLPLDGSIRSLAEDGTMRYCSATYFSRITVKKKNHRCESQGSWSLIRDGLVLTDFACCPGMAQHWNFTFHRVQGQGRHLVWDNVDGSVYRSITFLGKFLVPMAGVWRQAFDPWPMSSAIETVMRRLSGTMNGSLSSLFSSFFNMMPLGLE